MKVSPNLGGSRKASRSCRLCFEPVREGAGIGGLAVWRHCYINLNVPLDLVPAHPVAIVDAFRQGLETNDIFLYRHIRVYRVYR